MNKNESEFEIILGRFIISLAEELKLNVFLNWLSKKLQKLPEYKIWLLAFSLVIILFSMFYLLNRLISHAI